MAELTDNNQSKYIALLNLALTIENLTSEIEELKDTTVYRMELKKFGNMFYKELVKPENVFSRHVWGIDDEAFYKLLEEAGYLLKLHNNKCIAYENGAARIEILVNSIEVKRGAQLILSIVANTNVDIVAMQLHSVGVIDLQAIKTKVYGIGNTNRPKPDGRYRGIFYAKSGKGLVLDVV